MVELLNRYLKFLIIFVAIWGLIWVWNNISCRKVSGDEMTPTIKKDDFRIVFPKKSLPSDVSVDDVVYFDYEQPGKPQQSIFARVVGKPGDQVKIVKGEVYVNGKKIREDFVATEFRSAEEFVEVIVPRDTYFVVCDNRRQYSEMDSRGVGPIGVWAVVGKVKN